MDTLSQLFAILAALYVVECVRWTPRSTLVVRALAVRAFRRARLSPLFGSPRAGLIWLQPLPPLGTALHTEAWPLALSPHALATREPLELDLAQRAPFAPRALRWESVERVISVGRELHINGERFVECGSTRSARALAELVAELVDASPQARAVTIAAALERAMNGAELRKRTDALLEQTRGLRVLCSAQFVWIAVVTPAVVWGLGTDAVWLVVLAVGLVLHIALNLRFRRAFLALLPDCVEERRRATLACVLSPISAIRALDELARPLAAEHHPLAAATLVPDNERREIERCVAVDAQHPRKMEDAAPLALAADAWFRAQVNDSALRAGFDLLAALAPPEPEDEQMRAYCPRCLRQFADGRELCFDCTTPTESFPGRAKALESTR